MFSYHHDHANDQWNVFKDVNGHQEYVCSFHELEDARDFCAINNGVMEAVNVSSN
jgi:hypothetical protein